MYGRLLVAFVCFRCNCSNR